ncbi:YAK1-like protein 1 isoform X2 [Wolffia australiana]
MESLADAVDARGDGAGAAGFSRRPSLSAFRLYSPPAKTTRGEEGITRGQRSRAGLRVIVKKPVLARLTRDILETFQVCDPTFTYSDALIPKRFLTSPHVGVSNEGHDNVNSDLILTVDLELLSSHRRYIVKDILGHGTFGQVAKCWSPEMNKYVAVKVIKNHPAYYRQSWVEISILRVLNEVYDPEDQHSIVRILDYFLHQNHLCISFEMLGSNLYELLKMNHHKGLTLKIIRDFSQQILNALVILKDGGFIHCDLKPENILLCGSTEKPTGIKVIDFGSACKEGQTIYSYIQSRYYRSPEVLLGYPYDTAIDMWSVGCIVAELFLGLPLFPGASEFDLLRRMINILGGQPPDEILRESKSTSKYFKQVGSIHTLDSDGSRRGCSSAYRLMTEEEYESREMKKPVIGKNYFGKFVTLEEIIHGYPYRRNISETEKADECTRRSALIDFVRGLMTFDPVKRWSPLQASRHPFLTGESFTCPYKPSLETRQIPVRHRAAVEHNPGGGHWAVAGLSPQISNFGQGIRQSSPHFHQMPYSSRGGGSYCSFGSFGSYNENGFQGSSYGDAYFSPAGPSAIYLQAQFGGSILGASPDIRHRPHQIPHGSVVGFSPTGHFSSMPLGASPSQFTPPNSQIQVGPISPGSYGPLSPARAGGGVHGSPLGKGSGFSKHHRKWSSNRGGYHEGAYHHHPHPHDGYSSGQSEGSFHVQSQVVSPRHSLSSSCQPSWRQHRGSGVSGFPPLASSSSNAPPNPSETSFDRQEGGSSSPDPGDWDPNYSDELLLQEDNADVRNLASELSNGLHIDAGSNHNRGRKSYRPSFDQFFSNERRDEAPQPYSNMESNPSNVHDLHTGQTRLSRFGQPPVHRFPPLQSPHQLQRNRNNPTGQPTKTNLGVADAQSAANRWSSSWGS